MMFVYVISCKLSTVKKLFSVWPFQWLILSNNVECSESIEYADFIRKIIEFYSNFSSKLAVAVV